MRYFHPETQQKFNSKHVAQSVLKQLSPVLVEPVIPPRPDFATLSELPTLQNGVLTYEWIMPTFTAEETAAMRMAEAAQECSRRIYAIADQTAQMNMASMASAGLMSTDQLDAWKQALFWVGQMRGTWRGLAADVSKVITDNTHWPKCPVAAAALADGF
jgi:hypothetical protein